MPVDVVSLSQEQRILTLPISLDRSIRSSLRSQTFVPSVEIKSGADRARVILRINMVLRSSTFQSLLELNSCFLVFSGLFLCTVHDWSRSLTAA